MSLVPISNVVNIVAGTAIAQTRGDADRAQHDLTNQQRVVQSGARSEAAAGIDETNGDKSTHERDADGRLPYQRPNQPADQPIPSSSDAPAASQPLLQVQDPTGETGNELDVLG